MAQATLVRDALGKAGHECSIVVIETEGDRRGGDTPWGEGAFVAALERALLADRIDVAVHSAKDVPTRKDVRLRIAAYLPRADPRDALVAGPAGSLAELPSGARVGTDSPRRRGFLLARRPDLRVHPLHGNVDTRLRRLDAGETAERLDPEVVPPAPGQGAICLQVRAGEARTSDAAAELDDLATRNAVEAERALLAEAGGGCRAPIGALGAIRGADLHLLAGRVEPDGRAARTVRRHGPLTEAAAIVGALHADLWPAPAFVEGSA
jgi:hydroxymethylbilane synthase